MPLILNFKMRGMNLNFLLSLVDGNVFLFIKRSAIGRSDYSVAGEGFLNAVGAPTGNSGNGKQRSEQILGYVKHFVDQTGVKVNICADWNF